MAFNVETFKTRALTAVVFAIVMLAGLFLNQWSFFLLFSVIHAGCWLEYQKLVGLIDEEYRQINPFHKYGVIVLGWGFMLWMTASDWNIFGFTLHETGWWVLLIMVVVLPVTEVLFSKQFQLKNIGYSLLGLAYISLSWGLMIDLYNMGASYNAVLSGMSMGWLVPVILIASIWINDTMAYIVGSFIGKTPFSSISPKKTWEGTIGGGILAIITVTVAGYYSGLKDIQSLLVISAIAAIIGTTGDLLESKLKRMAGVKDSGSFMPGHGGFLDRFDSLVLATPFVWLYIKLFL